MLEYPTEEEIIELNRQVLREIRVKRADRHKVLNRAAITGAIQAAKNDLEGAYGKAAALLTSLVRHHAFESGNRRTAFLAALTFLRMNGESPHVVHDVNILLGIREGFYTEEQIREWLRGHAIPAFRRWKQVSRNRRPSDERGA